MSLFKKHLKKHQAEAEKTMEEKPKSEEKNDDLNVEASMEENQEEMEKTAEESTEDSMMTAEDKKFDEDPKLQEIGDAVEAAVEDVAKDVQAELLRANARPQVNHKVLSILKNNFGVLVASPYVNLKPTTFTKKEAAFIKETVEAAVEAVEEILHRSGKALKNHNYGKKAASYLDRRYSKNGYLRSCVAEPKLVQETRTANTKKPNILGLQ